jgi:hypothetical protein
MKIRIGLALAAISKYSPIQPSKARLMYGGR